MAHPMFKPFSI